jgi:hypothetical protein
MWFLAAVRTIGGEGKKGLLPRRRSGGGWGMKAIEGSKPVVTAAGFQGK